jgi:CTP:molybdopterin cytidylyltransferase MocA/SAM-dependent methyltransferase
MTALLGGKPILQHVLDTLHEAGVAPVVVVLGHASDDVRSSVEWRAEIEVVNRHPERGILRSVLLGLRRLAQTWSLPERTIVLLGDQPFLSPEQISVLLATPVDEQRPFVVPRYEDGQSGNPVLLEAGGRFEVEQFLRLSRATDDRGLSQVFAQFPDKVRVVDVPGANHDIDTTADLERLEQAAIVARGYDALGSDYIEWNTRIIDPARERMVGELTERLPVGARLLDLGCGAGVLSTKQLAETFDVTGVDVSAVQLETARRNIPRAKFIQGDMASIAFPPQSFDAVIAFYSIIHVPRDQHLGLFQNIARWLRPGGHFLAALSAEDSAPWTGEWLGQEMFFSGFDAATNRRLLTDAAFDLLIDDEVEIDEPEGPVRFLWVLARRRP